MSPAELLAAVAILTVVGASAIVIRLRQRNERLRTIIDSATRQLEQLQQAFQRFVPQEVVEDIIQRGVATHGERRDVTILFADLVGFTAMSERSDPEAVVSILNGYFQSASRAIEDHGGFLSKFMGDGLLALFGAPEPNPWQAMDAVTAALAMRAATASYNERLVADGHEPLRLSIGLHRGSVVAGIIGSSALVEYTVIGDAVNTAARIEALTRRHGVDILIGESVRERLDERFELRAMPPVPVKGKSEPVVTWAVVGAREVPESREPVGRKLSSADGVGA